MMDIQKMIDAIQGYGQGLTSWEETFIESCIRQFKVKGTLSDRQVEIIERIYSEKTPTGTSFGGQKFTHEPINEQLPSERRKNRSRRYD